MCGISLWCLTDIGGQVLFFEPKAKESHLTPISVVLEAGRKDL